VESAVVSFTYPTASFDVEISSLATEVFHCVNIVAVNCVIQGCPLMEKKIQSLTFTTQCNIGNMLHKTKSVTRCRDSSSAKAWKQGRCMLEL